MKDLFLLLLKKILLCYTVVCTKCDEFETKCVDLRQYMKCIKNVVYNTKVDVILLVLRVVIIGKLTLYEI